MGYNFEIDVTLKKKQIQKKLYVFEMTWFAKNQIYIETGIHIVLE